MATDRRTVFPVLEAIIQRRRLVIGLPLAAAALAAIAVLLMPSSYAASASFVAEAASSSNLPPGLTGLASQFGVSLGTEPSRSPAFFADLLRSREILGGLLASKIISPRGDSLTVYDVYRVSASTPERKLDEGIKKLRNILNVAVDQRTNIVHVTVEAPSAVGARDIL